MSKYYFRNNNDVFCYTISAIKEQMKNEGISKLEVIEAKRDVGTNFFYCTEYNTIGEKIPAACLDNCGKECNLYTPRNGKSGICKHSRNTYSKTDNKKTIKIHR